MTSQTEETALLSYQQRMENLAANEAARVIGTRSFFDTICKPTPAMLWVEQAAAKIREQGND